ncbi:histidinol-phosphate transaminase [Marilutibacter spongiae]|uniref:Histidinol-phosphate aminotransferase n=1 Tax=Marilutibacter spongiae TaxID=2025720 RepID=A0A7W3TLH7_9GAMM|nr:histidinol-phosphate transaminase [Lysobacter spongiae]MBB1060543.1 histidinol-phosphate transaminase [Lysobacter spongiae]
MSVMDLVREDLRDFAGYQSARKARITGDVWLNANESAWENAGVGDAVLRRYPEPQPPGLRDALAGLYGCAPERLLAGRGSDEAIDLLIRALCRPGGDAIVVTPPTFGMYAVCARLHGVPVVEAPLVDDGQGFACDFDGVEARCRDARARLVFLCSPGNPVGAALPLERVAWLAARLRDQAVVVVDEAYVEFAGGASAIGLIDAHDNIAVLRTLSKAHALAAARIGVVVAAAPLIEVLQRCQSPYPIASPCAQVALEALADDARAVTSARVEAVVAERGRLAAALADAPGVRTVYRSDGNFLLVRLVDAGRAFRALLEAGIVVRDVRAQAGLDDALRISIGTPAQNDRVIAVVAALEAEVDA